MAEIFILIDLNQLKRAKIQIIFTGALLLHNLFPHIGAATAFKRKYPNVLILALAEESRISLVSKITSA